MGTPPIPSEAEVSQPETPRHTKTQTKQTQPVRPRHCAALFPQIPSAPATG